MPQMPQLSPAAHLFSRRVTGPCHEGGAARSVTQGILVHHPYPPQGTLSLLHSPGPWTQFSPPQVGAVKSLELEQTEVLEAGDVVMPTDHRAGYQCYTESNNRLSKMGHFVD